MKTRQFKIKSSDPSSFSPNSEIIPVRVKDVILDTAHPEYEKYGAVDSIGVIKYAPITGNLDTQDTTSLAPAFPVNNFNKVLPLINEVVYIIRGIRGDNFLEDVDYYLPTLSLYNDINYIPSEDLLDKSTLSAGLGYQGNNQIRPLYPFHGDVILQGRLGHSIRFTGAKSFFNPFSTDSNTEQPLLLITNGHTPIGIDELYVEDINKDKSSIYLTSKHTIPLNQSRDKYAGAKNRPVLTKSHTEEEQIIINSGRIHLNSTTDDILFSSLAKTSITSEQVSIDGVSSIGLDAKKIYLGEKALRFELQPVLLGNQTELFLFELLTALDRIADAFSVAKTANQIAVPALNINGPSLKSTIGSLFNQINPNGQSLLKSKKVFTE